MKLKEFVKSHSFVYKCVYPFFKTYISMVEKDFLRKSVKIYNRGTAVLEKSFCGKKNSIYIGRCSVLNHTAIRIRGNNNCLKIGDNVYVGKGCSFWMEGNNLSITIGDNTTFTHSVHFCAQENNVCIEVGKDCMFSNNIIIRTSDSHPIYALGSDQRLNPAASVKIGNHVWIAPHSTIMKNADIENGAIIGSNTLINKHVPQNVLAVGAPMKIVKENIYWTRESLF